MLIYTDAGQNKKFKYFVFTNNFGKILGYKLDVQKKSTDESPEKEAVIAAVYWAKMRGGKNTVLTDFKPCVEVFYTEKVPPGKKSREFQILIKRLVIEANVNLTWIPRQINLAGKFLAAFPKGKASRDADRILEYFKEAM